MKDSYMEYMVRKKITVKDHLIRISMIVLTVFFFLLSIVIQPSLIIAGILAAVIYCMK